MHWYRVGRMLSVSIAGGKGWAVNSELGLGLSEGGTDAERLTTLADYLRTDLFPGETGPGRAGAA